MKEGFICLKKYINEKDYDEINKLASVCMSENNINLKLELDFKLQVGRTIEIIDSINEFLYYIDGDLIGYLGICSFGGNTAELNGMVHPDWRRKGIFTRLYNLAVEECTKRKFDKILLLSDDSSESGTAFINSKGAIYAFSEYQMRAENIIGEKSEALNLRKAERKDLKEIARQNTIYFGVAGSETEVSEDEEFNTNTFMIELNEKAIGKIKIGVNEKEDTGDIYGFGIVPEFRGMGYGRKALKAALDIIRSKGCSNAFLEVASKNSRALNLYKSCGFVEKSKMNYYEGK